ncbi:MAG: hypothetical protein K2Y23_25800 [Cyanobacteria bacterium]|nr:hypothetical protein [Cyanobacteriota bacterium]
MLVLPLALQILNQAPQVQPTQDDLDWVERNLGSARDQVATDGADSSEIRLGSRMASVFVVHHSYQIDERDETKLIVGKDYWLEGFSSIVTVIDATAR